MNQAEQELKRIEEELKSAQEVLDNPNKYMPSVLVEADIDITHCNQRKSDILLGLEAGRKEVFDFIDKSKLNTGSHFMVDEEDYQQFKEKFLGEKE